VHRIAETTGEADFAAEKLGHEAVEEKVDGELADIVLVWREGLDVAQEGATAERVHDVIKRLLVELADRRERPGEHLAVAAVRAEGEVVELQRIGLADGRGLLPDRQMGRTGIGILNAIVGLDGSDAGEHRLELADQPHVLKEMDQIGCREIVLDVLQCLLISVQRDVGERQAAARADGIRMDQQGFRHDRHLQDGSVIQITALIVSSHTFGFNR